MRSLVSRALLVALALGCFCAAAGERHAAADELTFDLTAPTWDVPAGRMTAVIASGNAQRVVWTVDSLDDDDWKPIIIDDVTATRAIVLTPPRPGIYRVTAIGIRADIPAAPDVPPNRDVEEAGAGTEAGTDPVLPVLQVLTRRAVINCKAAVDPTPTPPPPPGPNPPPVPPPPPDPEPEPAELLDRMKSATAKFVAAMSAADKARATAAAGAYRSVAANVTDGDVTSVAILIARTRTRWQAACGSSVAWAECGEGVRTWLIAMRDAGELDDIQAHAVVWTAVADAIEAGGKVARRPVRTPARKAE